MTMTTQFPLQYVAEDGQSVVALSLRPEDGEILYSADGTTFYQLSLEAVSGCVGDDDFEVCHRFTHLRNDSPGTIHAFSDRLYVNETLFTRQAEVTYNPSTVVPLPATRRAAYLCKFADGRWLYVSRSVYSSNDEGLNLYVGYDRTVMQQHQVINVDQSIERGAVTITTDAGTLYVPALNSRGLVPTWKRKEIPEGLTFLDPDDYDIIETEDDFIAITKK